MRGPIPLVAAVIAFAFVPNALQAQTAIFPTKADVIDPRLLRWESVAKELKLDAEQVQKVADLDDEARSEFQKRLNGQQKDIEGMRSIGVRWVKGQSMILRPEQMKRLREIHIQHLGIAAFADPVIHKELGLSQAQKETLGPILERHNQAVARIFMSAGQPARRPDRLAAQKRQASSTAELTEQTMREISAVLSVAQKKHWEQTVGKPFDFTTGT